MLLSEDQVSSRRGCCGMLRTSTWEVKLLAVVQAMLTHLDNTSVLGNALMFADLAPLTPALWSSLFFSPSYPPLGPSVSI